TVSQGSRLASWNTTPTWGGPAWPTASPVVRTSPLVGAISPAIRRSIVVLPHPDGPSTTTISSGPTTRSTGPRAVTAPALPSNRLVTPTSSMPAVSLVPPA